MIFDVGRRSVAAPSSLIATLHSRVKFVRVSRDTYYSVRLPSVTDLPYNRVVADILLPLLSTVERDFVAINVRVNPTTERKVMACIRFDTPPLTLRLSLSLLMHLRCF